MIICFVLINIILFAGVSLTLQDFGNHVRLSVMSDAQLSPHHTKITDSWANYFHNL